MRPLKTSSDSDSLQLSDQTNQSEIHFRDQTDPPPVRLTQTLILADPRHNFDHRKIIETLWDKFYVNAPHVTAFTPSRLTASYPCRCFLYPSRCFRILPDVPRCLLDLKTCGKKHLQGSGNIWKDPSCIQKTSARIWHDLPIGCKRCKSLKIM